MKALKKILVVFLSSTLLAQAASALEFTYSNTHLSFLQGYLAGVPSEYVGSNIPPFPFFSASFNGTPDNLKATFLSGDLSITQPNGDDFYTSFFPDVPATNSRINFNPDGSIAAWHFSLGLIRTSPQTAFNPGGTSSWLVESSYGNNTCNCDSYKTFYDIFTQRSYYRWQYVNTLGLLFVGESNLSNWSYESSYVPEPVNYLLFLSGLAAIGLRRFNITAVRHRLGLASRGKP